MDATTTLGQDLTQIATENKDAVQKDPYNTFIKHGVPQDSLSQLLAPPQPSNALAASSSGVSVSAHWWGFELKFNESFTQGIITGTEGGSAIAGIIAAAQPELAPVAGIIGGAIALEGVAIKAVDKGKGVHFNLNWAEIAVPPSLPAALIPIAN
ncbi:hypothetical protein [Marinagarivorans cellulosilyticus]|uniref:Uncharacterized protein n=1 Tax=Marinagarivorans cellulosilyticus TaxID=2721545 RepID=A0AAN2BLZ8_9GAMM|nr:hypothetical protein [Marinagarivorans cellulosilyticus]BCD99571.1 hypothetical protein MARGE09_P3773 [Marinagarivorans cellulosilyticus]